MKFRPKLLILLSSLFLSTTSSAFAGIYKITLDNYTLDVNESQTGLSGTLEGYIVIDESLVTAADPDYNRTTFAGPISVPDWITAASISFTNDDPTDTSNPDFTYTLESESFPIDEINWRIKESTATNGGFDPSIEFTSQMHTFGFINGNFDLSGNPSGGRIPSTEFVQQFYLTEATLGSPVSDPVAVPGPLPILGLVPLAWYFRKLKKKST